MLGELPGPPTRAEPGSSPLHSHCSPSVTKNCVPNLTNESGSSCASLQGSYDTGGGCYPARELAWITGQVSPPCCADTSHRLVISGSLLCHMSLTLILQGLCSLLTSALGAFPDKWGSRLPNRGSPNELQ